MKAQIKKDFLGNGLKVGDEVVFMQVRYRGLMRGVIKTMADKSALLEHGKTNLCSTETRQFYGQMIRVKGNTPTLSKP